MFDAIVDSPLGLPLICAAFAALVVSPGYMSPYMNRLAMPAPMTTRFPLRSFARAAVVAFVLLMNAASLFLAHRVPIGTDLVVAGVLMLLFIPPDEVEDGAEV
jgi:hypothetical protein